MLTDTHTHLYSEAFAEDRNQMMQRAFDAGIDRFFIPAIDSGYTEAMYALEKEYPENVFLMMGLHPTSVKENFEEELAHVEEQFKRRNFYAVGEIGIGPERAVAQVEFDVISGGDEIENLYGLGHDLRADAISIQ